MHTHSCIKCGTQYKDSDPDPYYCKTCSEEKKAIAEEVDKKLRSKPRKPTKSALQEYDEAQKVHGFVQVSL